MRFNRDIRPILAEHCLHCHGPDSDSRKGKLRLDLESDAKQHAIVEMKKVLKDFVNQLGKEKMFPLNLKLKSIKILTRTVVQI